MATHGTIGRVTEFGHCFLCGAFVELFTKGALGFGQLFERCTNPRCLLAEPHFCRPDPTAPEPTVREEAFSRTAEYERQRRERKAARDGKPRRAARELPIPDLTFHFMRI